MTSTEATEREWREHEEAHRAVGEAHDRQRDAERAQDASAPSWWQRVRRAFREARQS